MTKPELYDTVELLVDLPEHSLRAGALGAIVYKHADDIYQVEFANELGETLALCMIPTPLFMVVWRQATQSWVSLPEQMAELMARLGEPAQREILDFARFLCLRTQQEHIQPLAA